MCLCAYTRLHPSIPFTYKGYKIFLQVFRWTFLGLELSLNYIITSSIRKDSLTLSNVFSFNKFGIFHLHFAE